VLSLTANHFGGIRVLVTTFTTPDADDCVVTISTPSIRVAGTSTSSGMSVFVGSAPLVMSTASGGAKIVYSFAGAENSPEKDYTGPLILKQCGWTLVTAYATRPGSLKSATVSRNVSVTVR
jgi:hypothetical protein